MEQQNRYHVIVSERATQINQKKNTNKISVFFRTYNLNF